MSGLTLRPVEPADEPTLFALYASTRAAELAALPWTDAQKQAFLHMQVTAQRSHYQAQYPGALQQVILRAGEPVGQLWVDRKADRIHILDVTLLPPCRDHGVGTSVLKGVMAEAASGGQAVTIYVESYNPSVRFFERLGFVRADMIGAHILFRWTPVFVPLN